ncbi:MAG: cation-translocating P-type ATPase [Lachnospiraceae bacterium]|nr:cation-translocating P-type ATPase [Lachnospiraceae bacterium]
MKWYAISVPKLIQKTGCRPEHGLSEKEVTLLQKKYGPNELAQEQGPGLLSRFASQFQDFMILTLLAAALVSFLASYFRGETDFTDPCIILAIVIINAFIGVYQERKAEHSLAALRSLQTPETTVLRSGKKQTIPSSELVPGDIVCLEAGSLIPADGRLLTCHSLTTEESALTGETGAIHKTTEALPGRDTAIGDQMNCVFSGTMTTTGRGTFYVTHTGMDTQIGHIAGLLAREEAPETPLTRRLNKTGKLLGFLALAICAVVFFLGIRKNQPVFSMFMTSVSLGVAAIPESLPALVTIMLSLGVERMARQKTVIRHLPAVETLGSASVICSDKTGTLTENKMAVRDFSCLCAPSKLARLFVLCNDNAGPMEQALTDFAHSYGITPETEEAASPRIFELPFDSKRKRMTTLHDTPEGFLSVTKGAPEIILADSTHYEEDGTLHPMTPSQRKEFLAEAERFASQALRVLAVGYRRSTAPHKDSSLEKELVFAGLAGLMDPPRKEAYAAVKSCKAAGILPVMITGDHRITAAAIGRELGICSGENEVLTGQEIDLLTDQELSNQLHRYRVFARVSPSHKVRLVKLFQQQGNVVAMTGDGVNDAPALKAADIGCAMGKSGTDVAKNASDMILMDDNFSTIVAAVREGRGIFDNIKKAIHFLLSCNIGEIMTIFTAILFGLDVPLLPVQLLFINLVTDSFPALCLGVEPPDSHIMKRPPVRTGSGLFPFGAVFQMIVEGMFIGSLALFAYVAGNSTMCFAVLSLSQLVHSFNMRSQYSLTEIGLFGNKKLFFSVLFCIALQCSVITVPFLQGVFHTVPLTAMQWGMVVVLALLPIPLVELEKRLSL